MRRLCLRLKHLSHVEGVALHVYRTVHDGKESSRSDCMEAKTCLFSEFFYLNKDSPEIIQAVESYLTVVKIT